MLIFSRHANPAGQVHREGERAISRGMTVLSTRIEDVRPEGAMEYALGNRHWLDAFEPPVERHLELLAQSVRTLLANDVESVAVPKTARSVAVPPAKSPSDVAPRQRPPWVLPAVAVGVLMLGFFAAWMGGVFKFKTPNGKGMIVLEPLVVNRPEPKEAAPTIPKEGKAPEAKPEVVVTPIKHDDTAEPSFVPLFNGRDLSGWTCPLGGEDVWTVQGGTIRGMATGHGSTLATARSDFKDFHLRMEIRNGARFYFRSYNTSEDGRCYSFATGVVMPSGAINPLGAYMIKTGGTPAGKGATPFMTQDGLQELKTPKSTPLTRDTWYVVEIIAVGNVFKMNADGREVSAFSDTQSRLKQGQIAFIIWKGVDIEIRNIEIKELNRTHQ